MVCVARGGFLGAVQYNQKCLMLTAGKLILGRGGVEGGGGERRRRLVNAPRTKG